MDTVKLVTIAMPPTPRRHAPQVNGRFATGLKAKDADQDHRGHEPSDELGKFIASVFDDGD
jgi:hypothetical protein